jgi:hypothetical protein
MAVVDEFLGKSELLQQSAPQWLPIHKKMKFVTLENSITSLQFILKCYQHCGSLKFGFLDWLSGLERV